AAVVAATIAKGRITHVDASEALRLEGVLDVLTHAHRPRMAATDEAYKDEVAPEEGTPFRPLYDDKVRFSGQPVALVLAEDWEPANAAGRRGGGDSAGEPQAPVLSARRDKAFVLKGRPKPRGKPGPALAAAPVRHEAEYFIPIEHHNPMELYASTATWDGDG